MISIIVPVLNEETFLTAFLSQFKLFNVQGADFEVIIADGGSSDKTVEVVRDFDLPNLRIISELRRRAKQINSAADLATGETILFLHADTVLPSEALAAIEIAMLDSDVVGGRFKLRFSNRSLMYRALGAMINMSDRLFGAFSGKQAIFIRRSVFNKIGGFEDIEACEDLAMARTLRHEGKVVRIPLRVTTAGWRWQKAGLIRTIFSIWGTGMLFYLGVSPNRIAELRANLQ
jgi:rSAM/selenodomain-associated transferase 2